MNEPNPNHRTVTLENGRIYRLVDTQSTYQGGEYPNGGILIHTWEPRINQNQGGWLYISHSPNEECVQEFLKAAIRLKPLDLA